MAFANTVAPKSDQLNYDDFLPGQSKIISITGVKVTGGDQPASIYYEGDNNKPWKPCKSMRRVLIAVWGSDETKFPGRKLAIYGDPEVRFGNEKVGGIRISHMSHIQQTVVVPITATRGVRKGYTIKPLIDAASIDVAAFKATAEIEAAKGIEALRAWWGSLGGGIHKALGGAEYLEELKKIAEKSQPANPATSGVTETKNPATENPPPV